MSRQPCKFPEVVTQRESDVWALKKQGLRQVDIAARLDLTQSGVCRALQRIHARAAAELGDEAARLRHVTTSTAVRLSAEAIRAGHVAEGLRVLDGLARLWPIAEAGVLAGPAKTEPEPDAPTS